MFLGTDGDNTEDKVKKGRQTRGETNIHKLTSEEVLEIRRLLREGLYQHVIARQFGISQSVVSEIKNRKAWAHL
jgi:DNA-binding NarL/FixJ family response regulator